MPHGEPLALGKTQPVPTAGLDGSVTTPHFYAPWFVELPQGDGHTIMTIPGFMGADGSTSRLRKFLNDRGYQAIPWGLGRNAAEASADTLE